MCIYTFFYLLFYYMVLFLIKFRATVVTDNFQMLLIILIKIIMLYHIKNKKTDDVGKTWSKSFLQSLCSRALNIGVKGTRTIQSLLHINKLVWLYQNVIYDLRNKTLCVKDNIYDVPPIKISFIIFEWLHDSGSLRNTTQMNRVKVVYMACFKWKHHK